MKADDRLGARSGDYWWAGDSGQVGAFWHGYTSAWMPASLLRPQRRADLADAWFAASRHWSVTFHFNKGLAGASGTVLAAARDTAMNPQVLDAFALAIIARSGAPAFTGMPEPDMAAARQDGERIRAATAELHRVAPAAGSYLS